MSERPPVLELDKKTYDRALSCVHCGLCLAACPTYLETRFESDSPRGRIQLIRGLADGVVEPTEAVRRHLDLCLDCRACETACPSNVIYHELIEAERIKLADKFPRTLRERLFRWFCFHVVTRPARLRPLVMAGRLLGLKRLPPGPLWPPRLTEERRGGGKMKVGLLAGCVGDVVFDSVGRKAAELLAACGADVIVPRAQGCCGAIHYHGGSEEPAKEMARRNLAAFEGVDAVVSTAAGCGAMLKEYGNILAEPRFAEFSAKVRDVTEVLAELGLPEMKHRIELAVTYHDACHLAHAQKVTAAPRKLLGQIPGLKLIPMAQSDLCCGAAGTYFFTQPEMAGRLAGRKLANIAATGTIVCVSGNAGCSLHLRAQANARGQKLTLLHPVELLHAAVFGPDESIEKIIGAG